METIERDKKYLGRDVPALPVEIVGAKGSFLYGRDGTEYIDFLMGWNVGNIGWNLDEIDDQIRQFAGPTYVNPYYLYQPWVELAEVLARITPGNLSKSFRATGGTEAVEIAMQAAMSYTGRSQFLSIEGSYHGHSIGAMSVGMTDFRDHYSNLLPNCHKISPPLDAEAADLVEAYLKDNKVAAFILEPIICNLGVISPTIEFFKKVEKSCKDHGTLLIIDEVATGFGRTGRLFASEWYDLNPDIMCLGKAITGGYGALGATIMTDEVAKSMEYDFSLYSTFGWHPISVTAAFANIKYLLDHKLTEGVSEKGEYFQKRLNEIVFKYKPEIRVRGLAVGLEFKESGYAAQILNQCAKNGLLFADLGPNILTFFPALNIDQDIARRGLDIFERSVKEIS